LDGDKLEVDILAVGNLAVGIFTQHPFLAGKCLRTWTTMERENDIGKLLFGYLGKTHTHTNVPTRNFSEVKSQDIFNLPKGLGMYR
jgi:hypothetical protein